MSDDLRPCPFCGQTDFLTINGAGSLLGDMPSRPYQVRCRHLDCEDVAGPVHFGKLAAIAAWNSRADTAEVIALRARVAAAEKLAELVRLVHGSFGGGLLMTFDERDPAIFAEALAAYEATK